MFGRFVALGCAALLVAACGCSTRVATSTSSGAGKAASAFSGPVTPAEGATGQQQTSGADATRAIPCTAREVVLKPGTDHSEFNGMSHSGTSLTLTNKSRNACSVPGLPQLTFLDASGPVKADGDLSGAKLMHPGPVVLPIVLQPKQAISTSARWVSGAVYQDNLCYKLTGVTLGLRDGAAMTVLTGQMCGERSKGVHYDLQRYGAGAKQ